MSDPGVIHQSLIQISDFILKYAVTLAALGALTVGLLEAYKKVFATNAKFHRNALWRWLDYEPAATESRTQLGASMASGQYGVAAARPPTGYAASHAYAELLHLSTGAPLAAAVVVEPDQPLSRNIGFALFELELAKLMAQVQEAADAALNNPQRYPHWFAFLTRGCDPVDIAAWIAALAVPPGGARQANVAEVYARIRLLVRRQLDAFQTVTAYRWREWNQWWAWLTGALLMMAAQLIGPADPARLAGGDWLTMIVVSLAGGILAPVAKDLVDALSKVKSGG